MNLEQILKIILSNVRPMGAKKIDVDGAEQAALAIHAALLAEQAQPATGGAVCFCGHSIKHHVSGGCLHRQDKNAPVCECCISLEELAYQAERELADAQQEVARLREAVHSAFQNGDMKNLKLGEYLAAVLGHSADCEWMVDKMPCTCGGVGVDK